MAGEEGWTSLELRFLPLVFLGKYLGERANALAKNKQTNKNKKARIRPFPIVLVKMLESCSLEC